MLYPPCEQPLSITEFCVGKGKASDLWVVRYLHGSEKLNSACLGDDWGGCFSLDDGIEEGSLWTVKTQ